MASVVPNSNATGSGAAAQAPVVCLPPLHRIREVRTEQGISLKTIAKKTGLDERTLQQQEIPSSDIHVSDLYRWQAALDVPIADLLQDSSAELSAPIRQRAKLVRIMKTAQSLLEAANNSRSQRLAAMLIEQLEDLMPELKTVVGWPSQGSRRARVDLPKIIENTVPLSDVASNLID